jgi:hypothetical protein
MNLFKRFRLLWDKDLKPHCKHCFVLLKDIGLNKHLIHCPFCNKPMEIFNDKGNKKQTINDCKEKFIKYI